jgi:hypothetical protein
MNATELYLSKDIIYKYDLMITKVNSNDNIYYKIHIKQKILEEQKQKYNENSNGIRAIIKHICYKEFGEEVYRILYLTGAFRDIHYEVHRDFKEGIIVKGCCVFTSSTKCRDIVWYILKRLNEEAGKRAKKYARRIEEA